MKSFTPPDACVAVLATCSMRKMGLMQNIVALVNRVTSRRSKGL